MVCPSVAVAACVGDSCGGLDTAYEHPEAPPAGRIQPGVLAASVRPAAIELWAQHVSELLRAALPVRTVAGHARAIVYLPEIAHVGRGGEVLMTLRDGCIGPDSVAECPARDAPDDSSQGPSFRSRLELDLDTLTAAAVFRDGPPRVNVTLEDFAVFADLASVVRASDGNATCRIQNPSLDTPAVRVHRLAFDILVGLDAQGRLTLEAANASAALAAPDAPPEMALSVGACNAGACQDPTCEPSAAEFDCSGLCGAPDFTLADPDIRAGLFEDLLSWLQPRLVTWLAQPLLDAWDATPLKRGVAMSEPWWGGPEAAIPPVAAGDGGPLYFGLGPSAAPSIASRPGTSDTLMLQLDAGAFSPATPCVPSVRAPSLEASPPPRFERQVPAIDPATGSAEPVPYHLGLKVSAPLLQQLGYAFYQFGGSCATLGPAALNSLTGGRFVPTVATVASFAPELRKHADAAAPAFFQLHPTAVPELTVKAAAASPTMADLRLDFGDLGASVLARVEGSMLRLATFAAEVTALVQLVRTPSHALELAVRRVDVRNPAPIYAELSPSADWRGLAELVFETWVGTMARASPRMSLDIGAALQGVLGDAPLRTRIRALRAQATQTEPGLAAYLSVCPAVGQTPAAGCAWADELADAGPEATPWRQAGRPEVLEIRYASAAGAETPSPRPPTVAVAVPSGWRYQVQVDGTGWSAFRDPQQGVLKVTHPLLAVAGTHTLELRGRPPGVYVARSQVARLGVTIAARP